jgi:hypothetical protein
MKAALDFAHDLSESIPRYVQANGESSAENLATIEAYPIFLGNPAVSVALNAKSSPSWFLVYGRR